MAVRLLFFALYQCPCGPNSVFARLCTTLYATSRLEGGPKSLAPLFWESQAEKFGNPYPKVPLNIYLHSFGAVVRSVEVSSIHDKL